MAVMGAVLANPAAPYASHYQPKVCQWSNHSHSKTIIWKSEREKEKKRERSSDTWITFSDFSLLFSSCQPLMPYAFEYGVADYRGNNFNRREHSDGHKVQGSYSVDLPDGRVQTVSSPWYQYGNSV